MLPSQLVAERKPSVKPTRSRLMHAFGPMLRHDVPVVRRGNGGPLTDIYTFTPPDSTFSVLDLFRISINDNGTVAFPGFTSSSPPPFRYAILVGDGGPISTIVDTDLQTQFKALSRPSINNSGAGPQRPTCSTSLVP